MSTSVEVSLELLLSDGSNYASWSASVLNIFRAMGPQIEQIVDVSISPPSDDLKCLSRKEVKCLQYNAQATNVLFSALSEDVLDAVIFGDDEPLDDAHTIWTTLKERYAKSKCDEKLPSLEEPLEECSTSPTNDEPQVILSKGLSGHATSTLSPSYTFTCGTSTSSSSCETNILKEEEACDRWRPNEESTSPRDSTYFATSHMCLMVKGEKVKSKAKTPPPLSDISSSELSDSSSDDESSDEEIDNLTKKMDKRTILFINRLIEELDSVKAELATREDDLIAQENLYIANKEACALERSELDTLHKALAKEQEAHAITKKAHIALKQKYCNLDEKHKELEGQYGILFYSNSHPSKANDASTSSTSQGCGKCCNLDLNIYATNLANMEAMRKEIARLNEVIKVELEHTKGTKTNDKCVLFEMKEQIGTVQPAQPAAVLHKSGTATQKSSTAAPRKNGKATNLTPDQTKLITKMPRQCKKAPKTIKLQHQPKKTLITCFKCKKEGHHARNCPLKKEVKSMSKIQEKKKKMAHVKCCSKGHNASICSTKVDDQSTLPNKKTRKSKRKCYGCNEKEHEASSCPNKTSEGLVSSRKRLTSKVASKMQKEKANKNKRRLCYTCRVKGHLSMDCPMGNTPKLNLSNDSNMLRRPKNETCARKVIGSPQASTKFIWVPKSLVTNLDGPNIGWVPKCA
jgi:hypothetical protein